MKDYPHILRYYFIILILSCVFKTESAEIEGFFVAIAPSVQTTKLRTVDCGRTNYHFNAGTIWADAVSGANSYKFKFIRISDSAEQEFVSTTRQCNPYGVAIVDYGYDYYVLVKAKVDTTWAAYGDTCYFHMMDSIPPPKLTTASCGATNLTLQDVISSTAHTFALEHYFLCVDTLTNDSFYYHKTDYNPHIQIRHINGPTTHMKYGRTYRAYCKAKIRSTWSEYGEVCLLTMSDTIPKTKLTNSYCRKTDLASGGVIASLNMAANDYQYEFTNFNSSSIDTLTRGSSSYSISTSGLPGMSTCENFAVRVRWQNVDQWSDFGETCHIWTTCSIPAIQIDEPHCNNLDININTPIYSEEVSNADSIQWVFLDSSYFEIHRLQSSTDSIIPSNITELSTDQYYWVQVRAKVGSQWGVFLDTCFVQFNMLQIYNNKIIINTENIISGHEFWLALNDTVLYAKTGETIEFEKLLIDSTAAQIEMTSENFDKTNQTFYLHLNEDFVVTAVSTIIREDTIVINDEFISILNDSITFHYIKPIPSIHPDSVVFQIPLEKGLVVSPNNDNQFEEFEIIFYHSISDYQLTIKNRYDDLLFFSEDHTEKWNCKDSSQELVPRGPYIYELQFNGQTITDQFLINY